MHKRRQILMLVGLVAALCFAFGAFSCYMWTKKSDDLITSVANKSDALAYIHEEYSLKTANAVSNYEVCEINFEYTKNGMQLFWNTTMRL